MIQPLPETRQMEVVFEEVARLEICFGRPRLMQCGPAHACVLEDAVTRLLLLPPNQ